MTGTPVYRFNKIPFLKDLNLEMKSQGERIVLQAEGPWAEVMAPYLKDYLDWLSSRGTLAHYQGGNVYSLYLPPVPSQAHARMVEGFIQTFFLKKPTPQAVTIGVTNNCQCKCVHCSIPGPSPIYPPLSSEEIQRIVEESLALGVNNITFTGGEPLLNPDLEHFISAVPPELAVVQVFTNGLRLDDRRASSLKAAGAFAVQISLDSPDPEEHDRLRGKEGAFQSVRQAVAHALKAGLLVGLSTYATNRSLEDGSLNRIVGLAKEWGVHELSVFDVIPTGRLLHKEEIMLTAESRKSLRRLEMICNKSSNGLPRLTTQSWTNSGRGFAKSFGCLAGNYQFHITPCGDLMPCDFTPISFGNVRKHSLADLWEKLTSHSAYCRHQDHCRMQSAEFRNKYINLIPPDTPLPILIEELEDGKDDQPSSF
jgi:MoaA/NifB/PqqE/SkfB family radical SAM enzyme